MNIKASLQTLKHYSFVAVFIVIYMYFAMVSGGLSLDAIMNVLRHSAVIGIIALGMGAICLTGEIDLSVGSMLTFVAGFSVVIFNMSHSIIVTFIFAVASGLLCGIFNGFLVGYIKMPAFIASLASMLMFRSISQYVCQKLPRNLIGNGSSVYRMDSSLEQYSSLYSFGNGKIASILPLVGLVLIIVTALFVYITTSTKYGKKIYAVGSNEKAARLAGINTSLIKLSVFAIAGALVGFAAFLWIAMNGSADPATTGKSYEMYAIAAVVLGGISMSGGRGKLLGVLFGAMSYTVIDKIIIALKMDSLINDSIKGAILIIVILIQIAGPRIKEWYALRRLRKQHT
ncbi:ABC transporter permease [Collinsella sp. zg1085]|uniref:ABC transporter permease n=1 Tax=Collinsella sp. zg1085 TaxID=2844380 RepID=UPI001C0AA657|nr:ABC transporter permease [Collinsella sp. zg1085]QWT18059.1 ABC transporter permease [Collinsella sp. zg1085]